MLEVKIEQKDDIVQVTLSGPVDSATKDVFKDNLDPIFKNKGVKVVFDCENLTYMNSRALGLLSSYRRRCYVNGGRLALCNLNTKIVRTMDLLGLGKLLKRYDSLDEAYEAMRS
jgi:stage II sporulation protein AA (anti-sigma F factor antagonist)